MAFFRLQRSSVNKWCWRKSGEQHFSKFWFIYCCYSLSYANLWHHQFWERKVTLTPPAFSNTLAGDQHCRRQNTVPAGGHACGFLVRLKHLVHLCELSWSCRPAWLLPAAWSVFPFTPCFVPLVCMRKEPVPTDEVLLCWTPTAASRKLPGQAGILWVTVILRVQSLTSCWCVQLRDNASWCHSTQRAIPRVLALLCRQRCTATPHPIGGLPTPSCVC